MLPDVKPEEVVFCRIAMCVDKNRAAAEGFSFHGITFYGDKTAIVEKITELVKEAMTRSEEE
jgi:hypothetical protein